MSHPPRRFLIPARNGGFFKPLLKFRTDLLESLGRMKKPFKWLLCVIGALALCVVVAVILVIAGPKPPVVDGTDRPAWLPEQATKIFHRSQEGFGWWRAAEFTISEEDLRAYAAKKGWELSEEQNYIQPSLVHMMLLPEGSDFNPEDFGPMERALVYEKRQPNNGGVLMVFDPLTSRAYYSESHR
jgi:hypothetical protein